MKIIILIPYIKYYSLLYPEKNIDELEKIVIDCNLVDYLKNKGCDVIKIHIDETSTIHTWWDNITVLKPDLVWCDFYTAENWFDVFIMCDIMGIKRTCTNTTSLYFNNNKYLMRTYLELKFKYFNPDKWTYGNLTSLIEFFNNNNDTYIMKDVNNCGSTGIYKIENSNDFLNKPDKNYILETFIKGDEYGIVFYDKLFIGTYNVNILNNEIFTTDKKENRTEYYDVNKELPNKNIHIEKLQLLVNELNLEGICRFDVRIDNINNNLIILELNQPATCDYSSITPNIDILYDMMMTNILKNMSGNK
jgi:hypothetical protein